LKSCLWVLNFLNYVPINKKSSRLKELLYNVEY
jgi:hypothetical protein